MTAVVCLSYVSVFIWTNLLVFSGCCRLKWSYQSQCRARKISMSSILSAWNYEQEGRPWWLGKTRFWSCCQTWKSLCKNTTCRAQSIRCTLQSNVTWCNGKTATAEMRGGGMETKKLTVTTVHTGLTTLGSHAYCCGSKCVNFGFNVST